MPTYVYRRKDGTTFEIKQRITEDALTACPETGQQVERIISGRAGLIFKGDGFYITDYVRNEGAKKKDASKEGAASKSSDGDASSNGSKESASNGAASNESAASGSSDGSTAKAASSSSGSDG